MPIIYIEDEPCYHDRRRYHRRDRYYRDDRNDQFIFDCLCSLTAALLFTALMIGIFSASYIGMTVACTLAVIGIVLAITLLLFF